ncbi:XrtA system polysaccharide chain length determinant [Marilutibacter spongiae]|uniref:XrtA system polysaccharide chain length determinant n=1 Tax=Marilutibacter spongiae TaxID=2025720 RepID=UPI0031B61296
MTNPALEWSGQEQPASLTTLLPIAIEEVKRRQLVLVAIFAAIALLALAAGLVLPKKYTSSSTILVEDSNIIRPLMEGRAVATGVTNRASITRQVAFSQKVMGEILQTGGWMADDPSPLEQDKIIEEITKRTQIANPRENLIQISYTDSNPRRAYEVASRFADLVISESLATKEKESRDAYDFIDSQVRQYHAKLTDAEAKLEAYRKSNPDARPGIETDVNSRIGELRRMVESSRMDLHDLRSQEAALTSQLSGENEVTVLQTRTGQLVARLAELEDEQDRLLLTYTRQHPDVVRIQHQLDDLQAQLRQEDSLQQNRMASAGAINGSANLNPLYGELKSKLAQVRRQAAAMSSRISTAEGLLAEELRRSGRIAASESSLAELTRDYEVNRDLYQDLLKRRENARVSMSLDAEQRGLSFRIQEPARVPLRSNGLRLMHVAGGGLGMALAAPMLLLLVLVKFDPRIRSPQQIERQAGLPVLGAVPHYYTTARRSAYRRKVVLSALLFLMVPVVYGLVLVVRLASS